MAQIIELNIREVWWREPLAVAAMLCVPETQHGCHCSVNMFVGSVLVSKAVTTLHHITTVILLIHQYVGATVRYVTFPEK